MVKDKISENLKNDLLNIVRQACHYNIIERFWPSQIIELVDSLIQKYHFEKKYIKLRSYKIKKNPEMPKEFKNVLKILQEKL